jgi:hypothetical protein
MDTRSGGQRGRGVGNLVHGRGTVHEGEQRPRSAQVLTKFSYSCLHRIGDDFEIPVFWVLGLDSSSNSNPVS